MMLFGYTCFVLFYYATIIIKLAFLEGWHFKGPRCQNYRNILQCAKNVFGNIDFIE